MVLRSAAANEDKLAGCQNTGDLGRPEDGASDTVLITTSYNAGNKQVLQTVVAVLARAR